MKSLVILCVIALVGLTTAGIDLYPRGCIYVMGQCYEECEVGTHAYTTGCGVKTPEPTCDEPNPKPDVDGGDICDYSDCYCDPPTVRHPETKKCVPLEECPKKSHRECEEGTHAYTTGCGAKTPEATCAEPNPKPEEGKGHICDFTACYCDPPTVRHPETRKCVRLEECPKSEVNVTSVVTP
ncbi:uncharacterized protein LOC123664175 [Melitaea cinxia]|uniref:uncharacterized protein LOC123664175 n=1 Tax=Melitaea cinxia TaxID=113334 RepID=UPI001E2737FB|nr:uncharacterized protein LOC123664175 [Melitaea cinxia]